MAADLQKATSATSSKAFTKTPGFSGLRGEVFEIKLSSLIFLRAMNTHIHHFTMGSSVDGFGKFDDVVFKIAEEQTSYLLLQLKHKEKAKITTKALLASKKNDFSLQAYHQAYVEIEERLEEEGVKLGNCVFILYTNAVLDEKLKNKELPPLGKEEFLLTNKKGILKFNKVEHSAIYEELKDLEKLDEFLDHFRIMYEQATEKQLDVLVREELQTFQANANIDNLYKFFHSHMQDWWLGHFFLTEEWNSHNPLKRAKDELSTSMLSLRRAEIGLLGIRFEESAVKYLSSQILDHKAVVVKSLCNSTTITAAKVHQILTGTWTYMLVNTKDFVTHRDAILSTWQQRKFTVLVVECLKTAEYDFKIYNEMSKIMRDSPDELKLVVISMASADEKEIKHIRSAMKHNLEEVDDSVKLKDLMDGTQNSILNKEVKFQGVEIPLTDLLDPSGDLSLIALDTDMLSLLGLGNEMLQVGSDLESTLQYYINRSLETKCFVGPDILRERGVVFAVCNATPDELQSFLPPKTSVCTLENWKPKCWYVVLDDVRSFTNLDAKTAHCLYKDGSRFAWVQSKGNLDAIRRHLKPDIPKVWRPSMALDGEDLIVMVTAEAGMGKSSLMTRLANETKRNHPEIWVVRVNLNSHTKTLREMKMKKEPVPKLTVDMLCEAAGVLDKTLQTELFVNSLQSKGNMVVQLDGVDEVSPYYFDQVVQAVQFLSKTKVQKIWLTARPYLKKKLEERFGHSTFSLEPLTDEDQVSFLVQFWRSNIEKFTDEDLRNVAKQSIALVKKCFGDHANNLMGIPLQTLMLAEVFEEYIQNQDTSQIPKLPQKIALLYFYDTFVKKKWRIYIKNKKMLDTSNVHVMVDNEILHKKYIEDHKFAALMTIMSEDELSKLLNKKISTTYRNQMSIEKTGIITEIVDERPQFIHRTFAEYFVAKWFADNLDKREFLLSHLLEDKFKVVRLILDYILTDTCPLHTAILNGDVEDVAQKLEQCEERGVDKGGRTPLHIAVSYQHPDIVRLVLDNCGDTDAVDNILGWAPVQYATATNNWEVLAELLNCVPRLRDDLLPKDKIQESCLQATVRRGLVSLLTYMIDRGVDINFTFTKEGCTLLQEAARWGQTDITNLLISRGCSKNVVDATGRTSLHVASLHAHTQVASALIDKGCDVNIADRDGSVPLHVACQGNNLEVARLLVANGCDINATDSGGNTALHVASEAGNSQLADFLIDNHCNTNVVNAYGRTALFMASQRGHLDVAQLLVNRGYDVNVIDNNGSTVLHVASKEGHSEVVRFLISCKPDINRVNSDNSTALFIACQEGHLDTAEVLVGSGSDLNVADRYGSTPLHVASLGGHLAVVQMLVNSGANLSVVDKYGRTALHLACLWRHTEIATYLINKGCDISIADNDGQRALNLAP